jgi:hypothetical protein
MSDAPGQDSGQGAASPLPAGFSWEDYVAFLVEREGSLAAVAERLVARRGYADDAGSVERALRRLRARGQRDGGTWGARALAAFGLPEAVDARARWMGAYHSRFNDLPLVLCRDLVRLWDRPPVSDAPGARTWLALAHATVLLRAADVEGAAAQLSRARASWRGAPAEARAELLLAEAFVASRRAPERVPALLAEVEPLLHEPMPAADRACLRARWIDQRAYDLNKQRGDRAPDPAAAEALYRALPAEGAPAFALCRRANGLAYARWKQGFPAEGAAFAREACRHAGDGGHLRLRAMALSMLSRIAPGDEAADAKRRALAIAASLDDEQLRLRFDDDARRARRR